MDPDSYWIVDEDDRVQDYQVRDETITPRAPADEARVAAFKHALVSAGGGLVLPDQPDDEDDDYIDDLTVRQLTDDADDYIEKLVADADLRAAIARHPVARDPVQLERALAFVAGANAEIGTVADLQQAWLSAAMGLATMAKAGLLLSAVDTRPKVRLAA